MSPLLNKVNPSRCWRLVSHPVGFRYRCAGADVHKGRKARLQGNGRHNRLLESSVYGSSLSLFVLCTCLYMRWLVSTVARFLLSLVASWSSSPSFFCGGWFLTSTEEYSRESSPCCHCPTRPFILMGYVGSYAPTPTLTTISLAVTTPGSGQSRRICHECEGKIQTCGECSTGRNKNLPLSVALICSLR